jgi:MFS family permease
MFNRQSITYLISIVALTAASAIFFSTLNNFLSDIYNINAESRGILEFFREMPGVLAIVFLAAVVGLREKYIMVVASCIVGTAFAFLSTIPSSYYIVIAIIFCWSIGAHLNLVLQHSYGVALAKHQKRGKLFGLVGGIRSIGYIIGASIVWIGMGRLGLGYNDVYMAAAGFAFISAIACTMLVPKAHTAKKRRRFVYRKRYRLFYLLAILFGVRKQIFLVFAPWVLVKLFGMTASRIAALMLVGAVIGIFVKPLLGLAIDRFGERRMLTIDAIVLMFVCAGYGLTPLYFPAEIALPMLFVLYIMDDTLFSLRSAHTTYLSKIAPNHDELTSTISAGIAIEHVVSMTGPVFAGIIWMSFGFSWVFAICGVVAILMLFTALRIPSKEKLHNIAEQSLAQSTQ